jgi:hypothetical protein
MLDSNALDNSASHFRNQGVKAILARDFYVVLLERLDMMARLNFSQTG